MKRPGCLLAAVAALPLVVAGGWYFGSPWWTLYRMHNAAQAGNFGTLLSYIDRPALRENVQIQVRERLDPERLGTLGRAGAVIVVGAAVDQLTSERTLRGLFLDDPTLRVAFPSPGNLRASDMSMRREGLNRFRLVVREGEIGELIFYRHGLGWKLTDIRLPRQLIGLERRPPPSRREDAIPATPDR